MMKRIFGNNEFYKLSQFRTKSIIKIIEIYNHNHNNAQANVSNIGIYRESYDLFNHYRNNYEVGIIVYVLIHL